jgi:hypothetical protein
MKMDDEAVTPEPGRVDYASVTATGRLFDGWAVLPPMWDPGSRPASTKDRIFLAEAVMDAGAALHEGWGMADLKSEGRRLPEIVKWLIGCLRQGSIAAFARAEGGEKFEPINEASWLNWDAFSRYFWSCELPASLDRSAPASIYLDRQGFTRSLAVKRRSARGLERVRQVKRIEAFFESAFEGDPDRVERKRALMARAQAEFSLVTKSELTAAWNEAVQKFPQRKMPGRPSAR